MSHNPFSGALIADELVNDGTDSTVYSDKFHTGRAEVWSCQIAKTDGVGTHAAAITLWVSNKMEPVESTDADWVQMVAAHGWDGFPALAATPNFSAVGDEKDYSDISASGGLWYRFKFVRSAGACTISAWVTRKDER